MTRQEIQLPDEEGAQWLELQQFVRLLHVHGAPVITAVLQLDVSELHQLVLGRASERSEVCGQALNVGSTLGLQQKRQVERSARRLGSDKRRSYLWSRQRDDPLQGPRCSEPPPPPVQRPLTRVVGSFKVFKAAQPEAG